MTPSRAASVIVPTLGASASGACCGSVASADVQLIVVDNGGNGVAAACDGLDGVEVLRMERNEGYTRASTPAPGTPTAS